MNPCVNTGHHEAREKAMKERHAADTKIGCIQHDCEDCQQRRQSTADLVRESERARKQRDYLVKGLIQIRDSTYRNSTTLRAIAADILDTYADG